MAEIAQPSYVCVLSITTYMRDQPNHMFYYSCTEPEATVFTDHGLRLCCAALRTRAPLFLQEPCRCRSPAEGYRRVGLTVTYLLTTLILANRCSTRLVSSYLI